MIAPASWTWFGQAGHFIAAHRCRFHLHTHVGGYCVSTVGEYFPMLIPGVDREQPTEVGVDRLYETMVFKIRKDGDHNWRPLEQRGYQRREDANMGHMTMCVLYAYPKQGKD